MAKNIMKNLLFIITILFLSINAFALEIISNDFSNNGVIEDKFAYGYDNISPQISWKNLPKGTKTLALIMYDPDAPVGGWTHWILYGIPAAILELPQRMSFVFTQENLIKRGMNDYQQIAYSGPWPPLGQEHTYTITLYALDTVIHAENGLRRDELFTLMKGHILDETIMKVKYSR